MHLIVFFFLLLMITLLFCTVQNKTPYDQFTDDLAQETFLHQAKKRRKPQPHRG